MPDDDGEYVTMTGVKVSKITDWSKSEEKSLFEHDVPPTTRVLIDRYWQSDDVSSGHVILTFDIEVSKEKKHSKPQDAANPITAISYHDNASNNYVCLLLDPSGKMYSKQVGHIQLQVFRTEVGLITYFLNEWKRIAPNIVTGWNTSGYDLPYLYNRIKNTMSKKAASSLSPVGIAHCGDFGGEYSLEMAGVDGMDYLVLYKKFTYSEESSYKLEAIAQKELGKGKIEYDGTLDDLYANDIEKFIHYNVRDVELVVELNAKLDLISIAQGICHKGHVSYSDFEQSSRYLDGAALTYCKRNNLIAISNQKKKVNSGKAKGAFVKRPKSAIYNWIYLVDATSMYPCNIMSLNISPETKWGKVDGWDEDGYVRGKVNKIEIQLIDGDILYLTLEQFKDYLTEHNLCIASNGVLYRKDKIGLLPAILSLWFDERKQFNALSDKYGEEGNTEQQAYYARKQLITKILLNSFYGVLLLNSFRFYDRDIGESVTLTGQSLIGFTADMVNVLQNKRFGTTGIDYVVYQDTDSAAVDVKRFVDTLGDIPMDEKIAKVAELATEMSNLINKSFDLYATHYHNVDKHKWDVKLELIASPGFWGSMKKRYALRVRWEKNRIMDKMKIKGYDAVRSSFPKAFRKFMGDALNDVLHYVGADDLNAKVRKIKQQTLTDPIFDIMLPTGVKEMSKYGYGQKGTPMHVKSAQNYNKMLEIHGLENAMPIQDGDKILYTYLHPNPYNFDTIALVGYDDPPELLDFVNKYIDREALFERALHGKMQSIWDDLGWGNIEMTEDGGYF